MTARVWGPPLPCSLVRSMTFQSPPRGSTWGPQTSRTAPPTPQDLGVGQKAGALSVSDAGRIRSRTRISLRMGAAWCQAGLGASGQGRGMGTSPSPAAAPGAFAEVSLRRANLLSAWGLRWLGTPCAPPRPPGSSQHPSGVGGVGWGELSSSLHSGSLSFPLVEGVQHPIVRQGTHQAPSPGLSNAC